MTIEFIPFTSDHLPAAGGILAARHKRNRQRFPSLPARFEDAAVAANAVKTVFTKKTSFGFAALQKGDLLAYLIGETSSQMWGRCGFVYLPGYGLADVRETTIMQDLYALIGEEWNRRGCFEHYAYVSAADESVIDTFFSLGFGRERADALLDLRSLEIPRPKLTGDFEIRRAAKGDEAHLAELSSLIARNQSRAPRWHPFPPEDLTELAEGWAEIASDPEWTIWMAMQANEILGSAGFRPLPEEDDDMTLPPKTTDLTVAAVKESMRGRGIMSALTWYGLRQALENGYEFCLTNWQTANLLAARTWPRFGFRTVAYRLARRVNPMIAWAKG
ncbi:MAG: GNAT family N-acetyltransferase [Anaerolineaceae bacterium]|nr:MAG: GNAT family N-acetyltransferase [Anaerolineaceae bacterium]